MSKQSNYDVSLRILTDTKTGEKYLVVEIVEIINTEKEQTRETHHFTVYSFSKLLDETIKKGLGITIYTQFYELLKKNKISATQASTYALLLFLLQKAIRLHSVLALLGVSLQGVFKAFVELAKYELKDTQIDYILEMSNEELNEFILDLLKIHRAIVKRESQEKLKKLLKKLKKALEEEEEEEKMEIED